MKCFFIDSLVFNYFLLIFILLFFFDHLCLRWSDRIEFVFTFMFDISMRSSMYMTFLLMSADF